MLCIRPPLCIEKYGVGTLGQVYQWKSFFERGVTLESVVLGIPSRGDKVHELSKNACTHSQHFSLSLSFAK